MNVPINIEEFIKLAEEFPVIDVRSPAEFLHGHIPGAHNIPLLDNDERAKVGTAYKQTGRQKAIEIGLELVGPKLRSFIAQAQEVFKKIPKQVRDDEQETGNSKPKTVLVHCWRGGMRSANFAHLLNVYGYKTYTLNKGYKAYRNFVLESFKNKPDILIIGGETGSGKTEILLNISKRSHQIVDLEALANHKGSAFGSLGELPQPTQEQFENNLSHALSALDPSRKVWMEDEARSIGRTQLPNPLWEMMKQAPILRIRFPKELRLDRLMNDYGKFSKEELQNCILKIGKRLGPQHVKKALEELEKGNLREVADITLGYYDKAYNYNHEIRNMKDVFFVESETADASVNAEKLISFAGSMLLSKQDNLTTVEK